MTQSWIEAGRQAARRRRAQVLGFVLVILACATVWSFVDHQTFESSTEVSTSTVGGGRTVDTSPFTPAVPDATGLTTIPDGVLEGELSDPDLPPGVTTTTEPPLPPVPTEVQIRADTTIDSLCGMWQELRSFVNLVNDPSLDARTLTVALLGNIDRYVEVAPEPYRADADAVRSTVRQIVGVLEGANWDQSDPLFSFAIEQIGRSEPPYQDFLGHFARIQEADDAACAARNGSG